jgi:hypothetical protein
MDVALAFVTCDKFHVMLWMHTGTNPSDAEWASALARVIELKQKVGGDLDKVRGIVVSDGGAPTTVQRGEMFTKLLEGKAKVAAVTQALSNPLIRGVATAISWLNPNARVYPPDRFNSALEHLDLDTHRDFLLEEFQKLQKQMPPNNTLQVILRRRASGG